MFLTLLLLPMATAAEDILFIGNSYTISNNLPARVADVFEAAGQAATTHRLASGGLTLSDHAARASDSSSDWYNRLVTEADQRQWVILQDQSQIPGFPESQPERTASQEGAVYLNGLAAEAEAQTMFFLTWGYRNGDSHNDWLFPDFSTMLGLISDGYIAYATACATEDRPVWIAPVGHAFAEIHRSITDSGSDPAESGSLFHSLYSADGSHPSALGTQLAAYVFFASITGESPVGLPTPDGLDPAMTAELQAAAATAVFSSSDEFEFPWESTADATDSGDHTGRDSGSLPEDPPGSEDDSSDSEEDDASQTPGEGSSSAEKSSGCSSNPAMPWHRSSQPLWLFTLLFCTGRRQK